MDSHFEEIFQGWLDKEEQNKNKGFLKKTKIWKRYFCVLRRYDGDENVYFQWFEREEDWRKEFPKGSFGLFPKYSVFKRKMEKVKNVFEISNDEECHYFTAANEKTMDLWVIQLMMQTRLNASMTENSFRVKGGEAKCLQRIGAKSLNCLLHVSEWGITLALERTHSVLSQWPLTAIRNYECTDDNEFVFEAGRKSPMGEGKYHFHTTNSQDNEIFDQLDRYTSLRAEKVRSAAGRRGRRDSGDDDLEIAQAYGKLRWSVMLNNSTLNLGVIPGMSSEPQTIHDNDNSLFNRFQRNNSFQSTAIVDQSYDRLDRTGSFNERSSQSTDVSYSRLNCSNAPQQEMRNSRGGSTRGAQFNDSFGSPSRDSCRSRSFGSLEGRNQSQFPAFSSPSPDDNYNHLSRHRHSSWSSSQRGVTNGHENYDKLDRSTMSVMQEGASVNSYDHLDNMQKNMGQDQAIGPPNNTDSNGYDTFGNRKDYVPQKYNMTIPTTVEQASPAATVALPPPLPQKPSFMIQAEKNQYNPPIQNSDDNPITPMDPNLDETKNETTPQRKTSIEVPNTLPEPSCEAMENTPSHYQELDDVTETDFESAETRHRLNTRSSDTDLRAMSSKKSGKLDSSKRNTVHRSAPSLAHYTVIKKKKSEKSLSKSGSTFKLDGFLKKIARISMKGTDKNADESAERSYEKVSKKSRKSQQKQERTAREQSDSSSSLRRLVDDDASSTYAEIDDNVTSSGSSLRIIERSESKRPLPELPPHSSIDV